MTVGQAKSSDAFTTLDYAEFEECLARCALDKYKSVKGMREPAMITAFVANLLGEETTEESMNTATLITHPRFAWRREAQPLDGQQLREFKRWLGVWQRLELSDLYYFPIWEKEVHDLLQTHFHSLSLIFLAYSRSILGSDTAEDATEMEMAEFYDFVSECRLETRHINFDMMTNQFIKANAVNSAAAREQHHDARRSAGTKMDGKAAELAKVKGNNDGTEAVKDQELVLYEFLALLVRLAFWRASPGFGLWVDKDGDGIKDKEEPVAVPLALSSMLNEVILPRAKRENSAEFRETHMKDAALLEVLGSYDSKLEMWFASNVGKDTTASGTRRLLDLDTWLAVLTGQRLVGEWEVMPPDSPLMAHRLPTGCTLIVPDDTACHSPMVPTCEPLAGGAALRHHGRPVGQRQRQDPPLDPDVQGRLHGLTGRRAARRGPGEPRTSSPARGPSSASSLEPPSASSLGLPSASSLGLPSSPLP